MEDIIYSAFSTRRNILLHGPSGTGKTFQINELIKLISQDHSRDTYYIGAPTGLAATHINGSTIHSLFGLGRFTEPTNSIKRGITKYDYMYDGERDGDDLKTHNYIMDIIRNSRFSDTTVKFLIIDEISMVGAILLTIIDALLREKFTKTEPMGGIQCIFSGDFYQLPPVKDEFCIFTKVWDNMNLLEVPMIESKRYGGDNCDEYFNFINRLRKASLNMDDKKLLMSRLKAYSDGEHLKLQIEPLVLYPTNKLIDEFNNNKLNALTTTKYTFIATDSSCIYNTMTQTQFRDCERKMNIMLDSMMPSVLSLKIGANVIFNVNYDKSRGLVNGRLCKITDIRYVGGETDMCNTEDNKHIVNIDKYVITVINMNGDSFDIKPHKSTNNTKTYTCSRYQFPFLLGWAISIHRSQGMSLDAAIMNISQTFCEGQSYVSISRVRNIEGLFISGIDLRNIRVSKAILNRFQ